MVLGTFNARNSWSLFLILLIVFGAACAGSGHDALLSQLIGTWQWEGTSGGIAGDTTTPPEDDPVRTIVIRADRTFAFEMDGKETARRRFKITQEESIHSGKPARAIRFEDNDTVRIITLSEDQQTLTLSDNVHDGFSSTYRRRR